MATTWIEYLKTQGASEDDIKALDTPIARKAWDQQQTESTKLAADRDKFKADKDAYDKWYAETALPATERAIQERDVAVANLLAEQTRLKKLQEAGLIELAEQNNPGSTAAKPGETPAFDPAKHNLVTTDVLRAIADKEGEAIAVMADIAEEHRELFGTRLNARELRKQAIAAGKPLEQIWMETYNVAAKRAEKSAAEKAVYEKKIAEDAVAKYRSEQGNPSTASPLPSTNPFTKGSSQTVNGSTAQPWQRSEGERQNDRVNRALKSLPLQ